MTEASAVFARVKVGICVSVTFDMDSCNTKSTNDVVKRMGARTSCVVENADADRGRMRDQTVEAD